MKSKQLKLQSENNSPFWEINVLLVETNFLTIRLIEKVFENTKTSYYFTKIYTISDLNYELKYNKPDVIISGRKMDNFLGIDVLNQVNLLAPSIPVLLFVTDFNAKENTELVNLGAYDIIYHSEIFRLPKEVNFIFQSSALSQA
jgi:DNA-binding NtrC family response regulator